MISNGAITNAVVRHGAAFSVFSESIINNKPVVSSTISLYFICRL